MEELQKSEDGMNSAKMENTEPLIETSSDPVIALEKSCEKDVVSEAPVEAVATESITVHAAETDDSNRNVELQVEEKEQVISVIAGSTDTSDHPKFDQNDSSATATEEKFVQMESAIPEKELSMDEGTNDLEPVDHKKVEFEISSNDPAPVNDQAMDVGEPAAPVSIPKESIQERLQPVDNIKEPIEPSPIDSAPACDSQTIDFAEPRAPVSSATVSIQEEIVKEQQLEQVAVQKITNNSLSMLSQYSGSSDSEAEDTDASNAADGANTKSSSSSSDDSDVEPVNEASTVGRYRERDDPILISDAETMDTNVASSEDEDDEGVKGPVRTAGEILPHELPPIEELTITVPETECKPIGHIDSVVAQIVLVQSVAGAELLNLDTVLFLERGKRALGKIFDVIGQVNRPIYCVLFNSNQEVMNKNITVGMEVYCAPRTEYTSFIILSELMRTKGSDASWMNDNEVPAYLAEHSDDEEERMAKKSRKKGATSRPSTEGMEQPQQQFQTRQKYNNYQQQQQHQHQIPSTSRPPYHRPPPNTGRQFNPRYPSGHSWHHNYNNPRYGHPQPYQQRFPQRNQQFQQMPHGPAPPRGAVYLPNPFAGHPPSHPPPSGSN